MQISFFLMPFPVSLMPFPMSLLANPLTHKSDFGFTTELFFATTNNLSLYEELKLFHC